MRSIYLLFIILAVFSLRSYGQKAKSETIVIKQSHLPQYPFSSSIKTYAVEFISKYDKLPEIKKSTLNIQGYKQVNIDSADVIVKIYIDGKSFAKSNTAVTSNNKSAKSEIKMDIIANLGIKLQTLLIDKDGYNIHDINYPNYAELTQTEYKTSASTSSISFEEAVNEYSKKAIDKTISRSLNKILNATQEYLDENFAYYMEEVSFEISTGKGKKHNYSDLDKALVIFQQIAKQYSENQLTEEVKKELTECITIWNTAIDEYKPGEKKSRISDKNIISIYHNLSVAYYLLDAFDNALACCEKEIKLGGDETLIDRIIKRKKAVNKRNNNNS